MVGNVVSWILKQKIVNCDIKELLCDVFSDIKDYSKSKLITCLAGKFAKVTVFLGRVYALAFTATASPPEGHPKAVLIKTIDGVVRVWLVSFPKSKWDAIPDELKLKLKIKL